MKLSDEGDACLCFSSGFDAGAPWTGRFSLFFG
jgi:hypothetical protein